MDAQTRAYLDAQHRKYADQGHHETYETRFLLKHRHPLSSEYLARRKQYDALPFAAAARYRYYSFVDPTDYCQLRLPALIMGGKMNWTNIVSFDSWEYLVELAELDGWPPRTEPGIDRGTITIQTSQIQILEELGALLSQPVRPEWDNGHYCLQLRALDAADFETALGVIEIFHAGHLLLTVSSEPQAPLNRLPADICAVTHPRAPNCWL
jgi:hypothetical protein